MVISSYGVNILYFVFFFFVFFCIIKVYLKYYKIYIIFLFFCIENFFWIFVCDGKKRRGRQKINFTFIWIDLTIPTIKLFNFFLLFFSDSHWFFYTFWVPANNFILWLCQYKVYYYFASFFVCLFVWWLFFYVFQCLVHAILIKL